MVVKIGMLRTFGLLLAALLLLAPGSVAAQTPPANPPSLLRLAPVQPNESPRQEPTSQSSSSNQVLGADLLGLRDIGKVSTNIKPPADDGKTILPVNKATGILPTESTPVHSYVVMESGYRGYLAPAAFCHRPDLLRRNSTGKIRS